MAVEYTWHGDVDLDVAQLRAYIAEATGGEQHEDGTVFLPGMYVMAHRVTGDEPDSAIALFGFDDRFWVTFRFSARADEATTSKAVALMVHTIIAFSGRFGGRGVLLFNGEEATLQYAEGALVFGAEWADWAENSEVAPLLAQFGARVLPQPLL